MGDILNSKDFNLTFEQETTYGTHVDSAPVGLPAEDLEISIEPTQIRINRARGIRGQHEGDSWNDLSTSIPSASFSCPVTPGLMEKLFLAIFQKDSDWTGTPGTGTAETWEVYPQNYGGLPDVKGSNEGYFFTLARNAEAASRDEYITSAILTSLRLMISPTENDGLLYAECEFAIGEDYTRSATLSGTATQESLDTVFRFTDIAEASVDTVDIKSDFYGFELSFTNNGKLLADNPNGAPVFGNFEVSGELRFLYSATVESLMAIARGATGSPSQGKLFEFQWGADPVVDAGDLIISVFAVIDDYSKELEDGEIITLSVSGVFGDTGSNEYPARIEFGTGASA